MGKTKEYYIRALQAGRYVTVASEDDYTPSVFWMDENENGETVVYAFNPVFGTIEHPESIETLSEHFANCEKEYGCVVIVGGWTH